MIGIWDSRAERGRIFEIFLGAAVSFVDGKAETSLILLEYVQTAWGQDVAGGPYER